MFVDCANHEYSRDLEMMRGGYFDNYFMQLVSYVRKYKGTEETPVYPAVKSVGVEWRKSFDLSPAIYDCFLDGDMHRQAEGQGGVIYTNFTSRNVMDKIGVMHDKDSITFTIRTKDQITDPLGAGSWMKIFLNVKGGEGYQYVLNHHTRKDGTTTLGKVIGGGLPVGAFGGRADIMNCVSPLGPVYQAGTLSGNPVAMAAGLAQLRELEATDAYTRLESLGDRLEEGVRAALADLHLPLTFKRSGSMFCLFFTTQDVTDLTTASTADFNMFRRYFHSMLEQGVYVAPSPFETGFISTAHTEADIDATVAAMRRALQSLR